MSAHARGCRSLMWALIKRNDLVHHRHVVAMWHLFLVLKDGGGGDEGAHTCGCGSFMQSVGIVFAMLVTWCAVATLLLSLSLWHVTLWLMCDVISPWWALTMRGGGLKGGDGDVNGGGGSQVGMFVFVFGYEFHLVMSLFGYEFR